MPVAHRCRPLVLATVLAAVASLTLPASPSRAVDRPVVTAVFGDSFAAGEGLPGVDPGEAECQRALGRASGNGDPSTAWGITVLDRMKADQGLQEKARWFAACTSAATQHFKEAPQDTRFLGLFGVHRDKAQYDEAVAGTGEQRFDVVLSSFGGNDLGFGAVIMDCIGVDDAMAAAAAGGRAGGWVGAAAGVATWPVTGRCRPGLDAELRTKIDQVVAPNERKLYDQFYDATNPGALIVVAGYPQIFEDPTTSWATVNAVTGRCQGMHDDDADMLRGVAGRLNQAIGAEVKAAAARHPDRTWAFVDVSIPFAGHGLCSDEGDQWINGLTSGAGAGDFRLIRSFHPTQAGHTDGYAQFIVANKAVKEWRPQQGAPEEALRTAAAGPTWDQIKNASIPAMCSHPPTTLVDGKDVTVGASDGYFELLRTLSNGEPGFVTGVPSADAGPLTAVVVSCNAGGVGWPNSIMFFSNGGKYYGYSDLYEGVDWEGQGMNAPGRDGVMGMWLKGAEVEVYTSAETGNDASCCPSTAALLRLRPGNGRIVVTSLKEDIGD